LATTLLHEAEELAKDSEFMFPSPRGKGEDVPIDAPALSHAFRRICKAAEIKGIRLHDLRRTGASNMTSERLGIPRLVVSKVLNHTSDTGGAAEVTAVYDLNDYLPEKRKALDGWAAVLANIIAVKRDAA
jgi:integrase